MRSGRRRRRATWILIVDACEMDPTKQAAQIENFVAQRVDAILAAPCDSDAVAAQLASPKAAGIPVFTVDIAARRRGRVAHRERQHPGRAAGRADARRAAQRHRRGHRD